MADKTARLSVDGVAKSIDLPLLKGTRRARRDRHRSARRRRLVHVRPGIRLDRVMRIGDHVHRRRRRRAAVSRLSDRTAGRRVRSSRGVLPAAERRTAEPRPRRPTSIERSRHHTMVHEQLQRPLQRLSARRAPDGDHVRRRRCVGRLLPRLARHREPRPPQDHRAPPHREDADARGDELQVLDRSAVHVSAQRSRATRRTSCT